MAVQGRGTGEFTFVCRPAADAGKVFLVGDFNQWSPTRNRMVKTRDGSFRARVKLAPGQYQYQFLVDGAWLADPDAERQVPNPYGSHNSLLAVAGGEGP